MFITPRGSQPTKQDYEALVERIKLLEQRLDELEKPKRGRPPKEEKPNG